MYEVLETRVRGTRTIQSEIARGIDSNRHECWEKDEMIVFDMFTRMGITLHVWEQRTFTPRYLNE